MERNITRGNIVYKDSIELASQTIEIVHPAEKDRFL